jgi:integrase
MAVRKPPTSQFWAFDYQFKGRRYHGSTGLTTEKAAKKFERDHRSAIAVAYAARGGHPPEVQEDAAQAMTLDMAALEWWEMHGKAQGRPADEAFRLKRLQSAVTYIGPSKLVFDLRTPDIAQAIAARKITPVGGNNQGIRKRRLPAPATVNRDIIETIRPVINHAAGIRDLQPPPIQWARLRLKTPKPNPRDFSDAGVERFFETLPEHWRDFAHIASRYGLRAREMFFHPEEIEPDRLLILDRKSDEDHFIPLVPEDAAMLQERKALALAAGLDTVWFRTLKGWTAPVKKADRPAGVDAIKPERGPRLKALTYNGAIWAMRHGVRKAGLRGAKGSHDMRHHAAMTALRETSDIRGVQKLLGHSNIASTLVYAHAMPEDVRKVVTAVASKKSRNIPAPAKLET